MQVIIDRLEEGFAVVELVNRETVNMPRALLPEGAKPGDVLEIRIDEESTRERREKIESRMKSLWRKP